MFTPDVLRSAAKQSQGVLVIPLRLRRAIKKYLRGRQNMHMKRNVLRLSESFKGIKANDANLRILHLSSTRDQVDQSRAYTGVRGHGPFPSDFDNLLQSRRFKIQSTYGDIGLKYGDDQTVAYVASRMPAVFSACHRVLREVRRRIPDFSPSRVLDFGAGPGTAMWAVRHVWPRSLEHFNLVEPSQDMQRAGQTLLQGLKNIPFIQSFESIELLHRKLKKTERKHDLVISSYALGEIPSVSDRITVVRQLWDLTKDVLVLVEPGTPQGFKIISQMRSHILWMSKRKCRKKNDGSVNASCGIDNIVEDKEIAKHDAFVVAPCPHDGRCPLENTAKYCHFTQRLQRTSVQRAYKHSKSGVSLRGFEDEKFCFVALRRGTRPVKAWPLDGMKLETLKEQKVAKRNAQDSIIDQVPKEDPIASDIEEEEHIAVEDNLIRFASDNSEADETDDDLEDIIERDGITRADLGGGWGRIVHSPARRGRLVEINVCRSTNRECSAGAFDRVVLTKTYDPTLHMQAKKSLWGDLWPCGEATQ